MTAPLFPAEPRAVFSADGKYRYVLRRSWDHRRPVAFFCGLNPSKAGREEFFGRPTTGDDLDPTCRREIAMAKRWGCGEWLKGNLFGWVSTNPKPLREIHDSIGIANDEWLVWMIKRADRIVCCWGNGVKLASPDGQRARDVMRLIRTHARGVVPLCFRITKEMHVEHSLYQKTDAELMPVPGGLYG